MKTKALQAIVRGMAPVIRTYVTTSQQDVLQRLAIAETHLAALLQRAQDDSLVTAVGSVRERVAILETRPQLPGPVGDTGPAGKDGDDGKAGMTYHGVFVDGKSYERGDVVTWAGSMWHCDEPTTAKPGEYAGAKSWTMCVKRGRDGGVK